MLPRISIKMLQELLAQFPAVAILGPRQVGKTTLAFVHAESTPGTVYLDLEAASDRIKLSDPRAFFASHHDRLVILDEVQRAPDLFAELRGVIDARRRSGQRVGHFLLLGSASGTLLHQSADSLAGRVAYLELTPFHGLEVGADQTHRLWTRGGFPEAFLAADDAASSRWRRQFIATYLERDIPQFGLRIPAETLRRFWTMLAHVQGGILNAAKLAQSLAVSGQSLSRYLDLMVDLMLVRRLRPYASNEGKRLVRAPKVYVRDSGLVHALLGLETFDDLLGHPVVGGSFEGFVIENLLAVCPPGTEAMYYRTSAGAELDLVLDLPGNRRFAIEIKRTATATVSRGFHIAATDLAATHRFLVHSGTDSFPLPGGIEATSLRSLQSLLSRG